MSGDAWKYLPDPVKGINETQVYVKVHISDQIPNPEAALRFLRDKCPNPLLLKKVSQEGLTVILEANHKPKIVFGRSPPTGNNTADVSEIISTLHSNGLSAKLIG